MIKTDSNTAWDKFFTTIVGLFIILSFIGLVDSIYLTIEHYKNDAVVCLIIEGCNLVLKSEYSTFLGIPAALFGIFYYFLIFCFSAFSFRKRRETIFKYISLFTTVGIVVSLWLAYLQLFVIKAICTYCMVSAFVSVSLLIFGVIFLINFKKRCQNQKDLKKGEIELQK